VSSPAQSEASAGRLALAWGVHALTASGAVVGAAAVLAILGGDLRRAALLMLAALAIDSIDGTLARRVETARVLPRFDGRRLDDMVDYFNYVLVPAVFWGWAALPILASAYGFSQTAAKTEDDFFLGFPSYWNVVALYLWLLAIPPPLATAIVAAFSVLVFVPLKYVYPSKTPALRRTTAALVLAGGLLLIYALLEPERARPLRLVEISLLVPAYYFAVSLWLGGIRRRAR
jgi:phosphatidylcholine synthase